jgi:hypothetical protein
MLEKRQDTARQHVSATITRLFALSSLRRRIGPEPEHPKTICWRLGRILDRR